MTNILTDGQHDVTMPERLLLFNNNNNNNNTTTKREK
jgi:hypothetical protein